MCAHKKENTKKYIRIRIIASYREHSENIEAKENCVVVER